VIVAHFTQGDVPSMGLVLGLAFLFMGGRRLLRGERGRQSRGARQVALGGACLLVGLIAGFR
jgi:hypothetical protein